MFYEVRLKKGTDHMFINKEFESPIYEDDEIIYFSLKMLKKPRRHPISRNAFQIDYEHYVRLFESLQSNGYIDTFTDISEGGGHINYSSTNVTKKGEDFLKENEELEDLYQSFIEGL